MTGAHEVAPAKLTVHHSAIWEVRNRSASFQTGRNHCPLNQRFMYNKGGRRQSAFEMPVLESGRSENCPANASLRHHYRALVVRPAHAAVNIVTDDLARGTLPTGDAAVSLENNFGGMSLQKRLN